MTKRINIVGQRFGMYVVIEKLPAWSKWLCECDCGNKREVFVGNLKRGLSRSCGCVSKGRPSASYMAMEGNLYGLLKVIDRATEVGITPIKWRCLCECGKEVIVCGGHLRTGHTKSCGCFSAQRRKEVPRKHGKTRSKIYLRWQAMINRCYRENTWAYKWYGARGITVSDEWRTFKGFYEDMGDPPPGMELDRIDNSKGYSKDNCRWTTHKINCQNRRKPNGLRK